jgi:hypothetical protein
MTWEEMWSWIHSLPEDDPDKHEMLAYVWMTCARAAWRRAEFCRRLSKAKK